MIDIFLTEGDETRRIDKPQRGCWISAVAPTAEERAWLHSEIDVVSEFIAASLDDEESAHVDYDDDTGQTLVIVDCPNVEDAADTKSSEIVQYDTHPLSLLFLPRQDMLVTVSLRDNPTVTSFTSTGLRRINTHQRTRLLLLMLLDISRRYQSCLTNVNRQFTRNERELRTSMRNSELMKMLGFQNSLVYFSVSLKADESMIARINTGRSVKMYPDDQELLEDVGIEFRQAIEMCTIYSTILEATMDSFSNVISNNVNSVMQRLTIITLLMAIPTIIFSFYGMNVDDLPGAFTWLVPLGISLAVCVVTALALWGSRKFGGRKVAGQKLLGRKPRH